MRISTNRVSEIAAKEHTAKKKNKAKKYDEVDMAQMSLFDTVKDDDVLDELKNIDVGNLTPIDALNTIYRLQNKLKNPLVKGKAEICHTFMY